MALAFNEMDPRRRHGAQIWELVPLAPAPEHDSIWSVMPADGNRAASVGTGDLGTSPIFVQLSDKPLLASVWLFGVGEPKAQWRVQKLRAADSMMAWSRIGLR
jgi:hypothetical protein